METALKQLVMAVLMAGSVALGAQRITLDTMVVDAQGNKESLFENHAAPVNRAGLFINNADERSITFYVEVDKLLGARKLKKGKTYRLDSFSWIGHPQGWWTGNGRELIILNGNKEIIGEIKEHKSDKITVNLRDEKRPFTFKKNDILEVMISGAGNKEIHMDYFDAPAAPARIEGTAYDMLPDGSLAGGNAADHTYNRSWRYNSPAVRLRATELEDAYNWKRIGMLGGGVLIVIFLLKPLFGGRRGKRS